MYENISRLPATLRVSLLSYFVVAVVGFFFSFDLVVTVIAIQKSIFSLLNAIVCMVFFAAGFYAFSWCSFFPNSFS